MKKRVQKWEVEKKNLPGPTGCRPDSRRFVKTFSRLAMFLILLLLSTTFYAQNAEKPIVQDGQTIGSNIEKFVAPYLQMQDFSGAILISENGKILFKKGFGWSNLETRRPNTAQTKFRIGSLNKQITAAAILLLEEKGKLKTEDTVSRFFSDFPNGNQITIQHLLTHKSGFTKYVPYKNGGSQPTSAELLQIIGSLPPEAKPGERYNYSNAGFVLLALIVEKVSGQTFQQFLTENIFKRLGMENSGISFGQSKELATGYVTGLGTEIVPAPSLDVFNYETFSTVEDLNKWQIGLYDGKLLRPASLEKMTTDYGDRYGYGLSVNKTSRRYFGHDGVISGYNGFVTYFPDEKLSIVLLGNIESGALGEFQTNLPTIVFGNEVKTAKVRDFVKESKTDNFKSYVGRYEVFPGFYLDVKFDHETLALRGPLGAFIALTPLTENEFFYRHLYATVLFVKDENQKIIRLDWKDSSGGTYPCKKISSEF
jgi:CubicO group peptidase (beta-lactamase class C family)